jgi:alkanesulfonate monooxygenase SsuD/methylene tetrahydromethanopterin reductase-like flavin-dependent oxidoreductase (luciferase family)
VAGEAQVAQPLTFGVVIEQQHWDWASNVELWKEAEELGFESIWINDHFYSLGDSIDREGFEASTTLAALAMTTTKPKIGVLTYGNSHRNPAILFKEVATVDHMSGGRVIFGIGAGWNEPEHRAYGIPFPGAADRVAMLDEALDLFHEFETNDRTTFRGRYYSAEDAPFVPKPVNGHIPVLIGGKRPKMLRLIAKHADYWDSGLEPDELKVAYGTIRQHAAELGRDPDSITASTPVWRQQMSEKEFADRVRAFYAAGVRQMLIQHPPDRKGIEMIPGLVERVIPELRAELTGEG